MKIILIMSLIEIAIHLVKSYFHFVLLADRHCGTTCNFFRLHHLEFILYDMCLQMVYSTLLLVLFCNANSKPPRIVFIELCSISITEMQTTNGINSQLSITHSDRQDSGVYKCVAENPFGKSEHVIYVAVQG